MRKNIDDEIVQSGQLEPTAIPDDQFPPVPPLDPRDRLMNGRRAEALLNDPMLSAVFAALAEKYRGAFENAARGDVETMRVAHASLAALKDLIGALRAHLGNAKILEADIAAQRKRDELRSWNGAQV